jgi:hypothetical protein
LTLNDTLTSVRERQQSQPPCYVTQAFVRSQEQQDIARAQDELADVVTKSLALPGDADKSDPIAIQQA